jgi:hypothetical protein
LIELGIGQYTVATFVHLHACPANVGCGSHSHSMAPSRLRCRDGHHRFGDFRPLERRIAGPSGALLCARPRPRCSPSPHGAASASHGGAALVPHAAQTVDERAMASTVGGRTAGAPHLHHPGLLAPA